MICKSALIISAEGKSVQVSGKDTNLFVMVVHHWEKNMKLLFHTPFKSNKQPRCREKVMWWDIGDIVDIWGGCDTTSARHQQGM